MKIHWIVVEFHGKVVRMINRPYYLEAIGKALERSRVVVLTGPRQAGKTTLARHFCAPDSPNYFDLEDPVHLRLLEDPMTALRGLTGTVVIDEIQRKSELVPVLRVLADRVPLPAKFLILGSASPALLRQSSESLAGRQETIPVDGFSLGEVGLGSMKSLWHRGGFPLSFLAASDDDSFAWRNAFVQTLLEQDMAQFGIGSSPVMVRRFWTMLAHSHGETWNGAEIAQTMGIGATTVRRYLDILEHLCMIRVLNPWFENIGKRQVKSPKIYFRDSGLLHLFLGCRTERMLRDHPKQGASWEGFAMETVIRALRPDELYFWGTHNRAELDLLVIKEGRRLGFEFKYADAPALTASMRIAMEDLRLDALTVVYAGERRYALPGGIDVKGLDAFI